jgi:hypothetical protein
MRMCILLKILWVERVLGMRFFSGLNIIPGQGTMSCLVTADSFLIKVIGYLLILIV